MSKNSVKNSTRRGSSYTPNYVTSNKQLAQDYNHAISIHTEDFDYPKEIHQTPPLKMLISFAENEFERIFSKRPTHAVYAPAHVNLYGERTDFNDGKVLSMATQLVTVIVGTRRVTSRRCKVKTLSREIGEDNYAEFSLSRTGLVTSDGHAWVNYLKAVVSSFGMPREHIPGFKALIISSIPIKSGLGSSSALTVATQMFLEAITSFYTLNNLEKSIACQRAEKTIKVHCSIGQALLSVVGIKGKVMEFDPRTLQIEKHDWNAKEIDLILINSTQDTIDTLVYQKCLNQCREVAFALNLTSLRDATIPDLLMVKPLFSSKLIRRAHHTISETNRVTKSVELIEKCNWKQLGKLMWDSHCSMRDNFGSSGVKVEYIMRAIQNTDGVYGAKMISRGYGGFVLVMVHRRGIKEMVKALGRVAECQEYQVISPSSGAGILYTDGKDRSLDYNTRNRCTRKKANRHHLVFGDYESYEMHHDAIYGVNYDKYFLPLKAISMKAL